MEWVLYTYDEQEEIPVAISHSKKEIEEEQEKLKQLGLTTKVKPATKGQEAVAGKKINKT